MTLILYVFSKLKTVKNVIRQIPNKARFRIPLESQHGRSQRKVPKTSEICMAALLSYFSSL